MVVIYIILLFFYNANSYSEKDEFCANLECNGIHKLVCGIRAEGRGFRIRLFDSECELLKYGCQVAVNMSYGLINLEYCQNTFPPKTDIIKTRSEKAIQCPEHDCSYPTDSKRVCGIRQDGNGYRIRLFQTKCQLFKFNCENNIEFNIIDYHICNGVDLAEETNEKVEPVEKTDISADIMKLKNLVVVDSSVFNVNNNINDTIDNFFAATHVLDLPMADVMDTVNEAGRRMLLKIAGPVKVFKPWITIPKNISEDYHHRPTLSSCYHKCPMKCPETYAPVCGVPGIVAREPSLMFQNHCFMDVAQCKMHWEDKSDTALSSSYIESSFLFCLGDELNGLYRFLPLVRTLQHMGRLKKKGHFRYKLKNLRFFNNLLSREPKFMG